MDPETNHAALDVEHSDEKVGVARPTSLTHSPFFLEAAALLTLWSALVINEGAIRLINSNPEGGFSDGRPPNLVLFLGGLFEVIFGLFGLFVGVAALVFRYHSTALSKACIAVMTPLGYYVFIVFVFLAPAFGAADLGEPTLPGLSLGQSRFLITLGILTSFHFCLALQGGQFVFLARLICGATGNDFLRQRSGSKMRAIFWNSNLALSGLWTLILGIIVQAEVGGGTLDAPFMAPPNVGRMPGLTISTGAVMLLYGLAGAAVAAMNVKVPWMYYAAGAYVYLAAFLNFGIVQFGLLPQDGCPPSGPVALHNGLVFMVVFLGPYFVHQAQKDSEKIV